MLPVRCLLVSFPSPGILHGFLQSSGMSAWPLSARGSVEREQGQGQIAWVLELAPSKASGEPTLGLEERQYKGDCLQISLQILFASLQLLPLFTNSS